MDRVSPSRRPTTRSTTRFALVRDRDRLSLVLITHDLDTAALAHRVAVLDAGELVEQGPARQVLTAPSHPFTVSLTETTARLTAGT